jgi:hypothetical protein
MRFLRDTHSPPPRALAAAGEIALNSELRREFAGDHLNFEAVQSLLEEADLAGIPLDADTLEYTLRRNLEGMAENLKSSPQQHDLLDQMIAAIDLVYALPFDVNLRIVQDLHYDMARGTYPRFEQSAQQGDRAAGRWVEGFKALCAKLLIRLE